MISLIQQHWRLLGWFLSGIALTVVLSLGTTAQQTVTAQTNYTIIPTNPPEFLSSHDEPNFYQY
ncbi:hypothetical protein [Nostoc sp. FACHB-110]|uniref:hypothetical protein n=1 Tax=Nostoc sp. FACHB-110 TaxID=2692834 RepID=UPI001684C4C6|nr:hypothetical protein [Nostoc sp. FACHB-110]MBD2438057.1 hypothetical protein [Nostoc sp. FACHB-110]